jgi:hypothetical protein
MSGPTHFKIDYLLAGKPKSFLSALQKLDNDEAWHMSAVDAGFAQLPKYKTDPFPKMSKPKAEQRGISDVMWKPA